MTSRLLKEILIVIILLALGGLFIYGLGSALFPLLFSTFLAYASLPVVKFLETKGFSRLMAITTVLLTVILVLFLAFFFGLPPLFSETREAITNLPQHLTSAVEKINDVFAEYGFSLPYDKESFADFAHNFFDNMSSDIVKTSGSVLQKSLLSATSVVVVVLNIFLVPIFFVYVINDCEGFLNAIKNLVPLAWRPRFEGFLKECDRILSGFIRGQLLVCSILAVVYSTGLLIVGVKFGLLIGVLTGLFTFIPYVGFSFGLVAAVLSALSNVSEGGYGQLIGVLIVYGIGQGLETYVVTPRIVGNKVGLSAFEAILALIVFGNLLGFAGLFVAIPAGAILKVIIQGVLANYRTTHFYKDV